MTTKAPSTHSEYEMTAAEWTAETSATTATLETAGSSSTVNVVSSESVLRPVARRAVKRLAKPTDPLASEILHSVQDFFKRPAQNADRFDLFAAAIAAKLRDLSKKQRIFAEKIINETLAEGEMDSLTVTHKVMNSALYTLINCTTSPTPVAHSTSSPMTTPYYTPNPNYIVGYPTQLVQPMPQTAHQAIIHHPQPNIPMANPPVFEISIPEPATHYWSSFN